MKTKYNVDFVKSAVKELNKLSREIQQRITKEIDGLETEPRPFRVKKLSATENIYRIRSGNYRIVYEIYDKDKLVLITRIRHRSEVYK